MTEGELISRLTPLLPTNDFVVTGAGDDCAVLELGAADTQTLFKTDAVVEGVHFTQSTEPERVGRKALARCLSDVAAMGGTPTAALVTLGLPNGFDSGRVLSLYRGLNALAAQHQVAVVGGETTASPGPMWVSVSLMGTVPRNGAVLRSGARVGDAIFVTGELGGSIEGKHLDFEPRLAEGRWLARSGMVNSMMDLSDGLAADLPKLLKASGIAGAEILQGAVPISREARLRAKAGDLARPAILSALADGEDFELLVTVSAGNAVRLLDTWKQEFPSLRLSCIGRTTEAAGLFLRSPEGLRPVMARGHEHFSGE